jgi:hypothetical protein
MNKNITALALEWDFKLYVSKGSLFMRGAAGRDLRWVSSDGPTPGTCGSGRPAALSEG